MTEGPYTTIKVSDYSHITATLLHLRKRIQKARECLERDATDEALQILKFEDDKK